jgi:hypothetical protein
MGQVRSQSSSIVQSWLVGVRALPVVSPGPISASFLHSKSAFSKNCGRAEALSLSFPGTMPETLPIMMVSHSGPVNANRADSFHAGKLCLLA